MGLGGISIWQLLIILLIVVVLFGTKKLKSIGGDLGGALKGFKQALTEEESDPALKKAAQGGSTQKEISHKA
ncbi:twin-arginine translocase TatA/TatE family subunit [Endozoicomonas sp. 8E]|uniref:twin-arginine translocase TatA/TatE family subunit n=1 Tax=Endozoicomonas sp. 8E TaxID=3035692 RepID=UPI0029393F63|nr:twin-arginine translocase TatA/TatE family subunit [Endozoicomonas sp. 8E]WOG27348.1 twin-arginine translocase TatA/TatE family subunit [Endozoicomonas sp. 8E]